MSLKKYPFKFLDSYSKEDKDIFFGRDEEVETLYEMVFQSSIILIYGGSGTGKTSLINCGLASKFQPHDWLALMIRRGNNINDSLKKVLTENGGSYTTNSEEIDWDDEFSNETVLSPVGNAIKDIYHKSFRPIYLIFDQFEELFILGSTQEQNLFIQTVFDILDSKQPVKLIFSIREEYLGYLFDFEQAVPQLMNKKLRIEPMNLNKIKQVIIGASKLENSNIRIKEGEEDLVAEGIFEKIKGHKKSLTIQLPFLQVFLDKFYLKITGDKTRKKDAEFNIDTLNQMGEIGDILVNFLEEQVATITNDLGVKYQNITPEMVWKVLSPFSTLEGTKEPIKKQDLYDRLPDLNSDIVDSVVEAFINSRMLRYNEATDTFEIAHDSLAKPIAEKRSVEDNTLLEIKRLISSQVSVKEEAREFFTEKQLLFVEPFLKKIKIADEEQDWINKSRVHLKEQKELEVKQQQYDLDKKRKRRVLIFVLFIVLVALGFSGYSWMKVKNEKEIAVEQQKDAEIEKEIAKKQQKEAEKQQLKADSAKIQAFEQKELAEKIKDTAIVQQKEAQMESYRAKEMADRAHKQSMLATMAAEKAKEVSIKAQMEKAKADSLYSVAEIQMLQIKKDLDDNSLILNEQLKKQGKIDSLIKKAYDSLNLAYNNFSNSKKQTKSRLKGVNENLKSVLILSDISINNGKGNSSNVTNAKPIMEITKENFIPIVSDISWANIEPFIPFFSTVLPEYDINKRLRQAHFLAQVAHESAGFKATSENLNYSANALYGVFRKYFPTLESATEYARNPERIANKVYANRMGNGDEASGDGWKYRGRGLIAITGKSNYQALSNAVGMDFVANPDLVASPKWALTAACWYWKNRNVNRFADNDDIHMVTKYISGGFNGLDHRQHFLDEFKNLYGIK